MNKMAKVAASVAFVAVLSVFTGCVSALKSIGPKGPMKEIKITDIPPEYEGYYAMISAQMLEDPANICWPAYMTYGYYETYTPDTVATGEVKISTPCDGTKRLITLTFSKTKDKDNTSAAGFIYIKDAGSDVCKSKETMPSHSLSETQAFSFSDFMPNEKCKEIADAAKSGK